jgi:hypothetical protein
VTDVARNLGCELRVWLWLLEHDIEVEERGWLKVKGDAADSLDFGLKLSKERSYHQLYSSIIQNFALLSRSTRRGICGEIYTTCPSYLMRECDVNAMAESASEIACKVSPIFHFPSPLPGLVLARHRCSRAPQACFSNR